MNRREAVKRIAVTLAASALPEPILNSPTEHIGPSYFALLKILGDDGFYHHESMPIRDTSTVPDEIVFKGHFCAPSMTTIEGVEIIKKDSQGNVSPTGLKWTLRRPLILDIEDVLTLTFNTDENGEILNEFNE